MTVYYSATAAARYDVARRIAVADIPPRQWNRADVSRELKRPDRPAPLFVQTAERLGYDETAARINRWNAAGNVGDYTDPEYGDPSPLDLPDGAL